jgi:co-chaperonin GroES (HSP10)
MIENKSGLHPRGRAVLVKPYTPEVKKSIIELPESVRKQQDTIEQRAVVIEVGIAAWHDEIAQGHGPRAAAGEHVMISGLAGVMAVGTKDGEQYRFVNDRDIFASIEVEA